jgi:non-ribosomal peptide synthetase component F
VVVPEEVTRSPEDLHELLVAERVSVVSQTPTAVGVLPAQGLESTALMIAAEPCPAEVVERWAPGRVMINGYGPTETTVYATISAPLTPGSGEVPIGAPTPDRVTVCPLPLRRRGGAGGADVSHRGFGVLGC